MSLGVAALGAAAPAYAIPNSHNNTCQFVELGTHQYPRPGNTPGNAATSPGSVFNEPLINSQLGGKGGQAYNLAHASNKVGATAQYDTACANTLKTGTGTPMQIQTPSSLMQQIPNNALETRTDIGVVSHTGSGATK
jgi:hypothetical protein